MGTSTIVEQDRQMTHVAICPPVAMCPSMSRLRQTGEPQLTKLEVVPYDIPRDGLCASMVIPGFPSCGAVTTMPTWP